MSLLPSISLNRYTLLIPWRPCLSAFHPSCTAKHKSAILRTLAASSNKSRSHSTETKLRLPSALYNELISLSLLTYDATQASILPACDALILSLQPHQTAMAKYWQDKDEWNRLRKERVEAEIHRRETQRQELEKREVESRNRSAGLTALFHSLGTSSSPQKGSDSDLTPPHLLPDSYYSLPTPPVPPAPPLGLYFYGRVGTGKTLLLDLLFFCTAHIVENRQRVHYSQFMLDIYQLLHQYSCLPSSSSPKRFNMHSLDYVAEQLVGHRRLMFLALDELQLNDISECRILYSLLDKLWSRGVVLVMSGNRGAEELASVGIGESRDFIEGMGKRCLILQVKGEKDWRKVSSTSRINAALNGDTERPILAAVLNQGDESTSIQSEGASPMSTPPPRSHLTSAQISYLLSVPSFPYFYPCQTGDNQHKFNMLINNLLILEQNKQQQQQQQPQPQQQHQPAYSRLVTSDLEMHPIWQLKTVHVNGTRTLLVPLSFGGIAYCSFSSLCCASLSTADYLALCLEFHTVILHSVPVLSLRTRDRARRLIQLIDAAYNHHTLLIITAQTDKEGIFRGEDSEDAELYSMLAEGLQYEGEVEKHGVGRDNRDRDTVQDGEMDGKNGKEKKTLYSGEDEAFAFDRSVSRLWEMGSARYLEQRLWSHGGGKLHVRRHDTRLNTDCKIDALPINQVGESQR